MEKTHAGLFTKIGTVDGGFEFRYNQFFKIRSDND